MLGLEMSDTPFPSLQFSTLFWSWACQCPCFFPKPTFAKPAFPKFPAQDRQLFFPISFASSTASIGLSIAFPGANDTLAPGMICEKAVKRKFRMNAIGMT